MTVANTWPSPTHDPSLLASPTALASARATAALTNGLPSPSAASASAAYRPYTGAGAGGVPAAGGRGSIQSARPSGPAPPQLAERLHSVSSSTLPGPSAGGSRPPRPGSSPVAFGRNAATSPLRSASLVTSPTPGVIPHTGLVDRSPSPSPGGGPASASPSPVRSRPATATPAGPNPGTGHVNVGPRGAPLMMNQMARDLEATRDALMAQNTLAEAGAARVRQLEREKELLVAAFDTKTAELRSRCGRVGGPRELAWVGVQLGRAEGSWGGRARRGVGRDPLPRTCSPPSHLIPCAACW